ncbi:unnamed protein product [Withania somnifera]
MFSYYDCDLLFLAAFTTLVSFWDYWLLALAIISKVINHLCTKRKLPPGPRPWPIIGNLNLIGSVPHESLHHFSQKYGGLMLLKLGSKPVLVASSPEMPVFLKDHLPKFSLCTISRMVMSGKYHSDEPKSNDSIVSFENLQRMLDEWFILGGVINIGDWIPWLNWLDLQGYIRRMKALDLLAGGTDTSATTVEWAFQELARNPKIIEKANQELDRTIGKGRWVEEEDLPQLPYLEAIIKETFRLHPLNTLLAPHYSIEDCNVAGYDIPKGTMVFVNTWSLGRNPKYWDRPEDFIPERFLENDIDIKGRNFTLLPFGSGRRRCPGYKLGIKLVGTTMANLLHGFNWKLVGGVKSEDISKEESYGLTTHPKKPISIIMEPRLPFHLY